MTDTDTSFLSSDEEPNGPPGGAAKRESTEISVFLGDSVLHQRSSVELQWNNFAIERRTSLPYDEPELILEHHVLLLWDVHVAEGEMAYRNGRFSPYKKYPNTISTCHPGIRPAARSRSTHELIVGALDPGFIRGIEEELDKRPSGTFHGLHGTNDSDLRNLLLLLVEESETGGQSGTLYAESLMAALAIRLLYAARLEKQPTLCTVSPLQRRRLRRVLERMEADLHANLATLAAESGYSRAQFLRSFRAATGRTPHHYVMELRLSKAQTMVSNKSIPLIDIAAACGFSSHAHLTTAFRSRFGMSPSTYRRSL